jgi:hypothetical protein
MELRRRLQNLASQQIVEELEYRNQLQHLQNMQNQQSQQNNFNNMMAQNFQQQQYGHGDLLASLQDEYLLQRHQQLLMQEQMQQRLIAEGLAQVGNREQFENPATRAAYLEQRCAAALASDEALIEQARNLTRQAQELGSTLVEPTVAAIPPLAQTEINNVVNASSPTNLDALPQLGTTAPTTASEVVANPSGQNQEIDSPTKTDATKKQLKSKSHQKPSSKKDGSKIPVPAHSSAERESLLAVAKSLAQKKSPNSNAALEAKTPPNGDNVTADKSKQGDKIKAPKGLIKLKRKKRKDPNDPPKEKKPIQEITKAGKLDGRTKKARELKKQVLAEQRLLTDQEKSVVTFLSGTAGDSAKDKAIKEKKSKSDKKKRMESGSDDEFRFAAKIVLNFKATPAKNISAHDIKMVNIWSKRGSHQQYNPPISEKDYPDLTPNLKFNLPVLPSEPELIERTEVNESSKTKVDSLIEAINSSGIVGADDSASILMNLPQSGDNQDQSTQATKKAKTTHTDKWWPTDESIKQERKLLGSNGNEEPGITDVAGAISFTKKSLTDAKNRLETSVEPGVLEVLPHCKLHKLRAKAMIDASGVTDEPKFCFQVAEMFPSEHMICCSKCSTWRHAKCGGHYKNWTCRNDSNPLCDRCFLEQEVLQNTTNELATKRIDNQRSDHLRRCNATNAVMQQYAFSRHYQSKWPLGSVAPGSFVGHSRGVQARHEKAEKQWEEMVTKLDCGKEKTKDRLRTRSRALERLLHSVEDAGKLQRCIYVFHLGIFKATDS